MHVVALADAESFDVRFSGGVAADGPSAWLHELICRWTPRFRSYRGGKHRERCGNRNDIVEQTPSHIVHNHAIKFKSGQNLQKRA